MTTWDEREQRGRLVFPAAGEYSVAAVYLQCLPKGGKGPSRTVSNRIRFRVAEPAGKDAVVLDQIRRPEPQGRKRWAGISGDLATVEALIANHPRSPYLRLVRLELLHFRLHSGPPGEAVPRCGITADEILATDWGPFAPEALDVASRYVSCTGDMERYLRMQIELRRKYPHSSAAKGRSWFN